MGSAWRIQKDGDVLATRVTPATVHGRVPSLPPKPGDATGLKPVAQAEVDLATIPIGGVAPSCWHSGSITYNTPESGCSFGKTGDQQHAQ